MTKFVSLDRLEQLREGRHDESILSYITRRTVGGVNSTIARQTARRQYVSIALNGTVYEQEMPAYLKKFSPSGDVKGHHNSTN